MPDVELTPLEDHPRLPEVEPLKPLLRGHIAVRDLWRLEVWEWVIFIVGVVITIALALALTD
ncbi:MAG: hypothetical protein ACLQAT_18695 [Candidatus Binataceae bacterium]